MSTNYAWNTTDDTTVTLVEPGTGMGDAETGSTALVFSDGEDGLIVEGSRVELRLMLTRALETLDEAIEAALPRLTPGADGDEPECQHVWTAADVRAAVAAREERRAWLLGRGNTAETVEGYLPALPVEGESCSADLLWSEDVTDDRYARRWQDGTLCVGDTTYGDGNGNTTLTCLKGHRWAMPDVEYY